MPDSHMWSSFQEIRTSQEVSACNFPIFLIVFHSMRLQTIFVICIDADIGRLGTCVPTPKNDHTFARCATKPSQGRTTSPSKLHRSSNQRTVSNESVRHRRTHEARPDGEPLSDYQEEDLEGEEDHLNSLGEDSPESGNDYVSGLSHVPQSFNDIPGPGLGMTMAPPPQQLMAGSHY